MTPYQSPPPAHVVNVPVTDSRGLNTALRAAKPGTVILLAPGRYDGVNIDQIRGEGVTVTSANAKSPAVMGRFYISNTSGLTLSNLIFSTEGSDDPYPFRVTSSTGITLTNLSVHGSMNGNPQDDQSGIWVGNGSNHITIRNSEFQELGNGIVHANADGVVIDGNYIHDIGTDGIHGGGTSNITISNNHIADLHPAEGQHPDAIQFWTVNTKTSASHITVSGNLLERRNGGAMQGVFFGNEAGLVYKDVTVSDNVIIGAMYNGISVGVGDGVTVTGNKILQLDDQDSWMVFRGVANATVTGNQAPKFTYLDTKVKQTGNKVIVDPPKDKGASAASAWKAAHPAIAGLSSR